MNTSAGVETRRDPQAPFVGLVLLIDDDAHVRFAARSMLEILNYSVLEASDGEQGVQLFKEHSAELCAVLLDMNLPGISGAEVLRQLQSMDNQVPVWLCTGHSLEEARLNIDGKLLAGYLHKPYTPECLNRILSD